ncbi:sugar-binding protein [Bythopirellula goksoeyrii]|uniref:D-ribose-binding periplasmic protein n=1 Tax=Bythopirellula goksoeyrii TaxID=1400387 RepID=A0A5B9QEH5_9BACT|nr:sugar-binding protein [Bythopirellula goksoeyrii]QEG32751.1 D-ribose-binding periplasmic protein precursor [Bythopirellula goksoeyrii]
MISILHRLSRSITHLLVFSLMALLGCSDSADERPQFAFVTNGVASFWNIAAAGSKAAAKEAGVAVTVVMPDGLTDQTRKLEDLITRGIDGIAVSPINSANQTDILNKAAEATILITQDSDAPESNRLAYIGMDNYAAGLMCGRLVREALPEGGEVMLFIGRLDQDNAQLRRQGCIDAIVGREPDSTRRDPPGASVLSEDGKYNILGTLTDRFDRAKAKANVEDAITRYPNISAMVGLFVYNPPAILEALERTDMLGKVQVIGFDEDESTLQAIQDGNAIGTVVQDPYKYGYESIRLLVGLNSGEESNLPADRFVDVPPRTIKKENLETFWKNMKQLLEDK